MTDALVTLLLISASALVATILTAGGPLNVVWSAALPALLNNVSVSWLGMMATLYLVPWNTRYGVGSK